MQYNVLEARNQLSKLIDAAAAGEEVVIAKRGKPVVKIVQIDDEPPLGSPERLPAHVREVPADPGPFDRGNRSKRSAEAKSGWRDELDHNDGADLPRQLHGDPRDARKPPSVATLREPNRSMTDGRSFRDFAARPTGVAGQTAAYEATAACSRVASQMLDGCDIARNLRAMLCVSPPTSERRHGLDTADALHLATAGLAECDQIWTTDREARRRGPWFRDRRLANPCERRRLLLRRQLRRGLRRSHGAGLGRSRAGRRTRRGWSSSPSTAACPAPPRSRSCATGRTPPSDC